MKIYLDETDAPNPADREAAERVITEIVSNDVITKGSFIVEGYSAARRIARALAAARADERKLGFETPMPMRGLAKASGAPAVMAKWPNLHPLYHWLTVEGVRFQSYRVDVHHTLVISDDARIRIQQYGDFWIAHVDGAEVIACGLTRRFASEVEALQVAVAKIR